jgi:hypothetical protein
MALLLSTSDDNDTTDTRPQILYNIPVLTTSSRDGEFNGKSIYSIQKKITKHLYYKFLDKWMYDDYAYLLKYLKMHNGHVVPVLNKDEYKEARLSKMDRKEVKDKITFIEKYIFKLADMRHLLIKIINKLDIQWTDLTKTSYNKKVVRELSAQYVKRQLKKLMGDFK